MSRHFHTGPHEDAAAEGPDGWTERLSEYLDGELAPGDDAALEEHLTVCRACSATVEELKRVVQRAKALDDTPPRDDLWPGIAARLGSPAAAATYSPAATVTRLNPRVRRISLTVPQLAAACVALIVASAGGALLLRAPANTASPRATAQRPIEPGAGSAAPAGSFATSFGGEAYDTAVADLQRVLAEGRGRLDPLTLATLDENLRIIDQALEQARRAVTADPASVYLNDHLANTMRRKHELLRRATLLVST